VIGLRATGACAVASRLKPLPPGPGRTFARSHFEMVLLANRSGIGRTALLE
jgi:hypothetical protein